MNTEQQRAEQACLAHNCLQTSRFRWRSGQRLVKKGPGSNPVSASFIANARTTPQMRASCLESDALSTWSLGLAPALPPPAPELRRPSKGALLWKLDSSEPTPETLHRSTRADARHRR